jgi:hypothetical protein
MIGVLISIVNSVFGTYLQSVVLKILLNQVKYLRSKNYNEGITRFSAYRTVMYSLRYSLSVFFNLLSELLWLENSDSTVTELGAGSVVYL